MLSKRKSLKGTLHTHDNKIDVALSVPLQSSRQTSTCLGPDVRKDLAAMSSPDVLPHKFCTVRCKYMLVPLSSPLQDATQGNHICAQTREILCLHKQRST